MIHAVEYLSKALKQAREEKRLSQRALSTRVGMPQAQISKIENAAVDMQASTLIALARALDLELMLVPRNAVPAVKSLAGVSNRTDDMPSPAYRLDDEPDDG